MTFGDGDESIEELRLNAEEFELQRAELAGAQYQPRGLGGNKTIADF